MLYNLGPQVKPEQGQKGQPKRVKEPKLLVGKRVAAIGFRQNVGQQTQDDDGHHDQRIRPHHHLGQALSLLEEHHPTWSDDVCEADNKTQCGRVIGHERQQVGDDLRDLLNHESSPKRVLHNGCAVYSSS